MRGFFQHFRAPDYGSERFLAPGPLLWLRATPWAVAFTFLMMVAYAVSSAPFLPVLEGEGGRGGPGLLLVVCITTALAAILYPLVVRVTEKRWPSELDLKAVPIDLTLGILLGFALIAGSVGLLFATGLYTYGGYRGEAPWTLLAIAISSGVMEEIIMRGVVLRLCARVFGVIPGIAVSSLLFGFMHLGNPDATLWAVSAISFETGLLLAAVYLITGRLWTAIGLHAGWNFAQGYLFGAEVSGLPLTETLIVTRPIAGAPDWLTGGGFGPEGSLPAFILCTGVGIWLCYVAWKMGRFKRPGHDAPAAQVF